jgi:hypothetical protein
VCDSGAGDGWVVGDLTYEEEGGGGVEHLTGLAQSEIVRGVCRIRTGFFLRYSKKVVLYEIKRLQF